MITKVTRAARDPVVNGEGPDEGGVFLKMARWAGPKWADGGSLIAKGAGPRRPEGGGWHLHFLAGGPLPVRRITARSPVPIVVEEETVLLIGRQALQVRDRAAAEPVAKLAAGRLGQVPQPGRRRAGPRLRGKLPGL